MTKAKVTALDRITAQLRTVLRRATIDIILIGKLLVKAREHLDHGEWQSYLAENFDMSYRTSVNYVNAAEYAQKCNVADLANVSATVLYALAEGRYSEQEEAEILAQAKAGKRIDQNAAHAICEALAPPDDDDDGAADDGDVGADVGDAEDDDDADADDQEADAKTAAAAAAEAAAILDGPPPVLPPTPDLPRVDFTLRDFDAAISTLNRLKTKTAGNFARSEHSPEVLESVESFIRAVARVVEAVEHRLDGEAPFEQIERREL
jgi:hypothetical protein